MARLSDNLTIYEFIDEMKKADNVSMFISNKSKQRRDLAKELQEIKRKKEEGKKNLIDTVN